VAGDARLVAWTRVLDRRLDHERYTLAIGRFSDRPQLSDVAGLALEDEDLNDLRKCRPGDCGVKLRAAEMQEIRAAAAAAGDAWKPATQLAFRSVVVARARAYLDRGLPASAPYADRKSPVSAAAEFDEIAARVGFEGLYSFRVLPYLRAYPGGDATGVESFLYWSKERLGAGKPIVSITHVAIFRELSGATTGTVIASRQVVVRESDPLR
jgi:hypothetical protein